MSDKEKTYSPEEAAQKILQKTLEMYKNSSLYKSNSSHEVENGDEPRNDDAECPQYLAEADIEDSGKKKDKKSPEGSEESDDLEPEHEEDMDEEEEKEHDAAENEADEEDSDKIEADEEESEGIEDEEESEEESEEKEKKDKKDFEKNINNDMIGESIFKKDHKLKKFLDSRKEKNKEIEKALGIRAKSPQQGKQSLLGQQEIPKKPSQTKGY